MFSAKQTDYPVNKIIEADILSFEKEQVPDTKVMELKAYVLQALKNNRCKLWIATDARRYNLETMIYKDFSKLILADKQYSDEELALELKNMENKYNIWLNE